jgi:hypothetical protein
LYAGDRVAASQVFTHAPIKPFGSLGAGAKKPFNPIRMNSQESRCRNLQSLAQKRLRHHLLNQPL